MNMNRQNLIIREMEVLEVDAANVIIYVRPVSGPDNIPGYKYKARPLSSTPMGADGSGEFAFPTVGDHCVCMIVNGVAYILGYANLLDSTGSFSGSVTKDGVLEGDKFMFNRSGVSIWMSIRGAIHFVADTYAKITMSQPSQELLAWFRNLDISMLGGKILWTTNKATNRSKLTTILSDREEEPTIADGLLAAPIAPGEGLTYANKEITQVGYLGSGLPFKSHEIRAGANAPNMMPNIFVKDEYALANGLAHSKKIYNASDTLSIEVIDPTQTDQIRVNLVNSGIGGIPYTFSLLVGRDRVVLSHTGNIVLSGMGNIYIGGEGSEQPLVTKQFVTEIFATHTHMGADGAPTTEPLNLSSLNTQPTSEENINHVTYTTLAE